MKKLLCMAMAFLIFPAFTGFGENNKIEEIIDAVDGSMLFSYVETIQNFGTHPTGSEACQKVAEYIYNEFSNMGLNTTYYEWSNGKYEGKNVVAVLKGETNSSVILTAHYDSYPGSPGADDDGSGIACLLMAAKILSKYEFYHTIKFVAFSGEEQGSLGSSSYVRYLYDRGEDIIANINVDTVGHATSKEAGSLIRTLTNEASIWLSDVAEEICNTYSDKISLQLYRHANFGGSDHQSFVNYGYEAIFFVEYEFNKNMHTPDDTIEHVNVSYLTKVCRLIVATTAKIADMHFSVRVRFAEPRLGSVYINGRKIFSLKEHHAVIFGRVYAIADVISNEEIRRVEFYFDGEVDGFCNSKPYSHIYDNIALFSHSIKVVAVSENALDMSKIDIIMFNLLPPGPPH